MEEAIRYYFKKNYQYKTIIKLLEKFHDITISKGTLLNKLKEYGLRRRGNVVDQNRVRECIQLELDGSGQMLGYRAMWRRLQSKYDIQVPRLVVQTILPEIDPEGSRLRRANRLRRRNYLNPGPNYCWHTDGYDKLKPYGFPIHGCIDGFSRRILWLKIVKSNNDPRVVAKLFFSRARQLQFCPTVLRTDRGTENGIISTAQSFLRRNHPDSLSGEKAHRYGSSHSNQRIEAWWAMLRKSWSSWWINFFKDLVARGILDTSNVLHLQCLWFCFHPLMEKGLDEIKESWNCHYVRKSRHHTVSGIPNQLFYLPESVGTTDYHKVYDERDLREAEQSVSVVEDSNDIYQEYFLYSANHLELQAPQNWRDALVMYEQLLAVA